MRLPYPQPFWKVPISPQSRTENIHGHPHIGNASCCSLSALSSKMSPLKLVSIHLHTLANFWDPALEDAVRADFQQEGAMHT